MEIREKKYEVKKVTLTKEFEDSRILDIGGSTGIIGKLYGRQVVAIDKNKKAMENLDNEALNLVMDRHNLTFVDNSFDVVTMFGALTELNMEAKKKVLEEAVRVLEKGGVIKIWDAVLSNNSKDRKEAIEAEVIVNLGNEVVKKEIEILPDAEVQNASLVKEILKGLGLRSFNEVSGDGMFCLSGCK